MDMQELQDTIEGMKIRPVHPGEVLADVLEDIEISQTAFAEMLGVSRRTINEIVQGRRPVSVDMAIRLGQSLGNGPHLWLNLQQTVDIWDAFQSNEEEYKKLSKIPELAY